MDCGSNAAALSNEPARSPCLTVRGSGTERPFDCAQTHLASAAIVQQCVSTADFLFFFRARPLLRVGVTHRVICGFPLLHLCLPEAMNLCNLRNLWISSPRSGTRARPLLRGAQRTVGTSGATLRVVCGICGCPRPCSRAFPDPPLVFRGRSCRMSYEQQRPLTCAFDQEGSHSHESRRLLRSSS